jgi:hypothetical protein
VGSWQGTLTTMTGGSGSQPFTAEIAEIGAEGAGYTSVFAVGDEAYNVTGHFSGKYQEGEYFNFQALCPNFNQQYHLLHRPFL